MRRFSGLLLLLCAFCFLPASSQTFNMEQGHVQRMALDGQWRSHSGDDPKGKLGWAAPTFDDSAWPLRPSATAWFDGTAAGPHGFTWYRFQLVLPANRTGYSLYLPPVMNSYEVYADGKLLGRWGGLPPHARLLSLKRELIALPPVSPGRPMLIAIRSWSWFKGSGAAYDWTGPRSEPSVGETGVMREWLFLQDKFSFWSASARLLTMVLMLIGGIASLALFAFRTTEREYLWFGLYEFLDLLYAALLYVLNTHFYTCSLLANQALWSLSIFLLTIAQLLFVWRLLGARRDRLFYCALASTTVTLLMLESEFTFWAVSSGSFSVDRKIAWDAVALLFYYGYLGCTTAGIIKFARRRVLDARLLLLPFCLLALATVLEYVAYSLAALGFSGAARVAGSFVSIADWPVPFGIRQVSDLLVQLATLAVVLHRFVRSRRDEQRFASELEAARAVQQVLVPREAAGIEGFHVESVYRPAGQVGGDFFQIIPLEAGGALVAIGDVSGKGMPAAMTVSLLVGTFRTLAHYTHSPAEILSAMNQRMIGRTESGFTTCLVLRIGSDGTLSIANAGHIPPYVNSSELDIVSGLPLGLVASAEYVESTFQLAPGENLTLLTDGVIEARNSQGELLGFERARDLSKQPAEQIAEAAQRFGQEDDITVLTLRLSTVPAR